jgi:hypothetical protein
MVRFELRRILAAAASALLVVFFTHTAHAQRDVGTPLGGRGTLSIDQLSGFRMSAIGGNGYGVGYSGIIGFSTQSVAQDQPGGGTTTGHYTSFWIAPSADYFVIDHLSIGGLLEVATTSANRDQLAPGNTTVNVGLPTQTSITFLPRIGWMFAVSDRFGIWPRLGLGYGSHSEALGTQTSDTFSSFLLDLDVGFLYRINENWFIKGAPEITFASGSDSAPIGNNATVSVHESVFQFGLVGGIGVMFNL